MKIAKLNFSLQLVLFLGVLFFTIGIFFTSQIKIKNTFNGYITKKIIANEEFDDYNSYYFMFFNNKKDVKIENIEILYLWNENFKSWINLKPTFKLVDNLMQITNLHFTNLDFNYIPCKIYMGSISLSDYIIKNIVS